MKKLNKKVIAFGTSMFLLGGVVIPAAADSWLQNIQVRMGVNLDLDGQIVQAHDASGKPMPVMLYDSTTYVPVRFISEHYGKNVSWDPNTTTVHIGNGAATTASYLVSLPLEHTNNCEAFIVSPDYRLTQSGQQATNGFMFSNDQNAISYFFDGKYKTLKFTLGTEGGHSFGTDASFEIWGNYVNDAPNSDPTLLYTSLVNSKYGEIRKEVDVSNIRTITFGIESFASFSHVLMYDVTVS